MSGTTRGSEAEVGVTWDEALDAYERLIIGLENGHVPPSVDAAYQPVVAHAPTPAVIARFQTLQDRAARCEQQIRTDMDEIQGELRELGQRRDGARGYAENA